MSELRRAIDIALRSAAESHGIGAELIDPLIPAAWSSLCDQLGTRCVYVPAPDKARRNAAIVAAWREGQTLSQIAAERGLTSNRIRQILSAEGALKR
jgi:Mor family transcriptional regulator